MKKLLCTLLIFLCAAFFSGTVEASAVSDQVHGRRNVENCVCERRCAHILRAEGPDQRKDL